jgi:hypothetical protein
MELAETELSLLFSTAAELGATIAMIKTGQLKPYLTKSQAFRRYGRKHIEKWVSKGLLTVRKDGDHSAAWRLDLLEIEFLIAGHRIRPILGQR